MYDIESTQLFQMKEYAVDMYKPELGGREQERERTTTLARERDRDCPPGEDHAP
jgi:hypothetical protein